MDFDPENQSEDGFDQIEDKQASDQEAEKPKGSSGEDENPKPADVGTVQNPASTVRICDFCGRTFNNGKALGGHRRYHLQLLRKEAAARSQKVKIRLPITKIHNNDNNSNCVNDIEDNNILKMEALISSNNGGKGKGKPTCDLCNKNFPSMKSYYGHMRSHPERNRRALLLPLSRSPKSDDDSVEQKEDYNCGPNNRTVIAPDDDESPVHLTKSLPSWAKTDQRGRKSIGGAEAAQNLVYLSHGGYFSAPEAASTGNVVEAKINTSGVSLQRKKSKIEDESPPRKQKMRKIEACGRGKLKLGDKIDDNDDGCGNGKIMDKVDKEEEEEGEGNADWGEEECDKNMKVDVNHLDESKMMMMKKKENKRKKTLKLKFPECPESEENLLIKTLKTHDGHRNKSTAPFRALLGHKSSHNKEKNIETMDEVEDKNNETKGNKRRGLVVKEADTAHALDDQRRRLCSRRSAAETRLSEEASSAGASLSRSTQELGEASPLAPRVLDFDLNEPYVTDDKETKSTFSQE